MVFDTFISYNSNIVGFVESIYRQLKAKNLNIFFDKEHIKLGDDSIDSLEMAIKSSKNILVFIGEEEGPWQRVEIKGIINELVEKKSDIKIIPILLPNVSVEKIPLFLKTLTRATLNDLFDFKTIDTIIDQLSNTNILTPIYNLENGETEDKYGKPLGFKAHTEKIITLLIGESIYQNHYVAIRELIQNAVDACERRNFKPIGETPQIEINIQYDNSIFEIIDNGDGMSLYTLKNNFIAIGKSISDDITDENIRRKLIGQFGIGFISTFMIAEKVSISTQFAEETQINFDIISPSEKFKYFEKSHIGRSEGLIGTTIKIHIKPSFKNNPNFNIVQFVHNYCRHIPNLKVFIVHPDKSKQQVELFTNNWNTNNALIKKQFSPSSNRYTLNLGINNGETHLISSNYGFLINYINPVIIPYNFPNFVGGEINFEPAAIKLNIARNEIIEDDLGKVNEIADFVNDSLRTLLIEAHSFDNKTSEIKENIKNLLSYYLVVQNTQELPLSQIEIIEMLVNVWEIVYDGILMPIKNVFIALRNKQINRIYFLYNGQISSLQQTIKDSMEKQGYVFIVINDVQVPLKKGNSIGYPHQTNMLNALNILVVSQRDFELRNINQLHENDFHPPEEINVPQLIIESIDEIKVRFKTSIKICNLYDNRLYIKIGDIYFINFGDVFFYKLIRDTNSSKIDKKNITLLIESILALE